MYVGIPPRSSTRPTGVPMCFTPEKQQLPGAEASVGDIIDILRRDERLVFVRPLYLQSRRASLGYEQHMMTFMVTRPPEPCGQFGISDVRIFDGGCISANDFMRDNYS